MGAYEPFRDRVHPRRLRRGEHRLDTRRGEHGIEGAGELAVAIPEQPGEPVRGLFQVGGELPRQLHGPGTGRTASHAEQVDPAGGVFDHERHV